MIDFGGGGWRLSVIRTDNRSLDTLEKNINSDR